MTDVPYFKPPEEGPLWPDEADTMAEDATNFLIAYNRDVSDAVARQNGSDKTRASFKVWLDAGITDGTINIEMPEEEKERNAKLDLIVEKFFPFNPEQ